MERIVIFPLQLLTLCVFLFALLHNKGIISWALTLQPVNAFGAVVYPFYAFHWVVVCFSLSTDQYSAAWVPNQPLTSNNAGGLMPFAGISLTFVVAYIVQEYYQSAVMDYIEPAVSKCLPSTACGRAWNEWLTGRSATDGHVKLEEEDDLEGGALNRSRSQTVPGRVPARRSDVADSLLGNQDPLSPASLTHARMSM